MGSSMTHIVPEYVWFLEPAALILFGLGLGYTTINKQWIFIVTIGYFLLGVFNYLHLVDDHKMNWYGTFETTDRLQANLTHVDDGYLADEHTRFTADDVAGVRLMDVSMLLLALAVYLARKNFFGLIWFEKGIFSEKMKPLMLFEEISYR